MKERPLWGRERSVCFWLPKVEYPGEHDAIVSHELFDRVQDIMDNNRRTIRHRSKHVSIMAGMIIDAENRPMSPTHANRDGKRYRYYCTRLGAGEGDSPDRMRVPAGELEKLICDRLGAFFADDAELGAGIGSRDADAIAKGLRAGRQAAQALAGTETSEVLSILQSIDLKVRVDLEELVMDFAPVKAVLPDEADNGERVSLTIEAQLARRGPDLRFAIAPGQQVEPARKDTTLIKLMATAHAAGRLVIEGEPSDLVANYSKAHLTRMARLSFLAPDIVSAILEGRQPVDLTTRRLLRATNIPLDWAEQREFLGFS